MGQNPGPDEEEGQVLRWDDTAKRFVYEPVAPRPFLGKTGYAMVTKFFPLAGLVRGENVSIGNVLRCRRQVPIVTRRGPDVKRTNEMPSGQVWRDATATCATAHLRVPASTKLIIAQGAHAWRALGCPGNITDWRGHLAPNLFEGRVPIYGVLHLADIRRDPKMEFVAELDWQKVPRILSGEWPVPAPQPLVLTGETFHEAEVFFHKTKDARFVALDTEYPEEGEKVLSLIGLGYFDEEGGAHTLQVRWMDRELSHELRSWFRGWLDCLIHTHMIVMHNALADVPVLQHNMGIAEWDDFHQLEDTMQAHAVLWCELPHTLEFLGSIYGRHPKAKHLAHVDPIRYNQGDVLDTASAWMDLEREFVRDPESRKVYRTQMRCLPGVDQSMWRGIAVNKPLVPEKLALYGGKMEAAQEVAHAYVGYPLNLNSDDQLKRWLYQVEGLPIQRDKETKQPTIDKDAVAVLRSRFLEFDPEEKPSTSGAIARIEQGAHPLLEARFLHSNAAQCVSHYLYPLINPETGEIRNRIFHGIHLHAQKNARWSYVDPPLAQLPDDLEDLLVPDPDWPWFGWDWDGIELIEVAAECQDPTLLHALEQGWDVHTMTTVAMFDLPLPPTYKDPHTASECASWREVTRWKGKVDARRVFSKRFGHRQSYGGTAKRAGDIPGAKALGLSTRHLVRMSHARAALFPRLAQWQNEFVAKASLVGETRDWFGRRRRYLAKEGTYLRGEMLDHPMQAGVQEIAMLTFLEILERFGSAVYFVYGKHDSQKWGIHRPRWQEITPAIREIVQQPRNIHGRMIRFPATFKEWQPPCETQ